MSAPFRLHCFGQSGNAYKVALMLALSGAEWEPVFVDFFGGQQRTPAWRASVNPLGEVPVLDHDGQRLSQSGVILDYLVEVLGRFGPADGAERREILRWVLFDNHKFTGYFAAHRFLHALAPKAPDPAVLAFLRGRAAAAYQLVDDHLRTRAFMVGERPTIADFSLAGYVYYPEAETGFDLAAAYPAIDRWRQRLAALPGWQGPYELMPGAPFLAPR